MSFTPEQLDKITIYLGYDAGAFTLSDPSATTESIVQIHLNAIDAIVLELGNTVSITGVEKIGSDDPELNINDKISQLQKLGKLHINQIASTLGLEVNRDFFGTSQNSFLAAKWI